MNVYNFFIKEKIDEKDFFKNGSIMLLGKFDIFHKGHFKLLEKAREKKTVEKIGILLIKNNESGDFQSLENKLDNLSSLGIDFVCVCNFDYEFKSLDGKEFIKYLDTNFNVKNYIVGEDFMFGNNRKYSAKDISSISEAKVDIIDFEKYNGIKISSSNIRQMHEFGEYNIISNLVVFPLIFDCKVVNKIIVWDNQITRPHTGIYYTKMLVDGFWYHGIIQFSLNDTINYYFVNLSLDHNIFDQSTKIQILDISRIIINQRFDKITYEDINNALNFFRIKNS